MFMIDGFYPSGIPSQIRQKLLLHCGNDIVHVQEAIEVFENALNVLFSTIDLLQYRMDTVKSPEFTSYLMKPASVNTKTKTVSRGIDSCKIYL